MFCFKFMEILKHDYITLNLKNIYLPKITILSNHIIVACSPMATN